MTAAAEDGFTLSLQRPERGTFGFPAADAAAVAVTATEPTMILGGIDLGSAKRRRGTNARAPDDCLGIPARSPNPGAGWRAPQVRHPYRPRTPTSPPSGPRPRTCGG